MTGLSGATREWRHIARNRDVRYSVLGWPGMRGRWTDESFYATGDEDWADFVHHWQHFDRELGGSCAEIGCGLGRMTRPMAGTFERVVALDVADEMVQRTRAVCPPNVEVHRVDGPVIPVADGELDAVFSCHVLQHLETSEELQRYLREARRVLRPGGSAMLHIPLQSHRRSRLWRAKEEARLAVSRLAVARGRTHFAVRMLVFPMEEVLGRLGGAGFAELEVRVFAVRSNGFMHHFFLARA